MRYIGLKAKVNYAYCFSAVYLRDYMFMVLTKLPHIKRS